MKTKLLIISFMSLFLSSIFTWGKTPPIWQDAEKIRKSDTFKKATQEAINNSFIISAYSNKTLLFTYPIESRYGDVDYKFEKVYDKAKPWNQATRNLRYSIRGALGGWHFSLMEQGAEAAAEKHVKHMFESKDPNAVQAALDDLNKRIKISENYLKKYGHLLYYADEDQDYKKDWYPVYTDL